VREVFITPGRKSVPAVTLACDSDHVWVLRDECDPRQHAGRGVSPKGQPQPGRRNGWR